MENNECIFCKILNGEIPSSKIYEDENVIAFLDLFPVNKGHSLVVPKAHYENILDTPPEVLEKIVVAVKKVAQAVLKATESNGFNLGVNNGEVAGQVVPHVHFHIMPRFKNDGRSLWKGRNYDEGEMDQFAKKIRNSF